MSFLKSSFIYLGTSIINKSLPFLLLPLLTNYLSPSEFGALSIFQVSIAFLGPFINLNSHINISIQFHKKELRDLAIYISNIYILLLGAFIILTLGTCVIFAFSGNFLGMPSKWLLAAPLISLMASVNLSYLTILRNQNKPFQYGIIEVSQTAVDLILTILFVILYLKGWEGRALGILLSSTIFGFISFIIILKKNFINIKGPLTYLKDILKISLPLIPFSLGAFIINFTDRIFIETMEGKSTLGIYSVGYSIGMLMMLFTDSFIKSWSPWFFKTLHNPTEENKIKIVQYSYIFFLGIICIATLLTIASYIIIPLLINEKYHGATQYVGWVAFGYVVKGFFNFMFQYLAFVGKTSFLGTITIASAVINLFLNYYLIKLNGAIGAAQATFISFLIIFIGVYIYAGKVFPMPWFDKKIFAKGLRFKNSLR